MKIFEYLKTTVSKYGWEIGGAAILLFVVLINLFPAGYIIDSGDVVQYVNLKELYFEKIFFLNSIPGCAPLFYVIFYLLDLLGVSDTGQLSWYLGIFLFGSYISFQIFCRSVFPGIRNPIATLLSLFYAANIYTLYIFTSTWGFTSYQVLYVFIPALTGLYMQALWSKDKKPMVWFLAVVCIASMSFSNPAFAVSTAIYFALLTALLFSFRLVEWERVVWLEIAVIVAGTALLNMYWILPLIPKAGTGIENISSSSVIVLPETLRKTSNAIFDSIRLMQTSEQEVYYPENFPYPDFVWMKPLISLLAFVPFFLIMLGLFQKRSDRERKLYYAFFGLFVVFIALVARVRFPFDLINDFLFQLPGMNVLRGYDKLAIFVPFIMSASLLVFFSGLRGMWSRRIALVVFSVLAVLLALPFYFGGIQTKMSHMLTREGAKDYREANYSALVKIPEPYHDIARIFDEDTEDNKISMLPYSPGSSIGKVNLPIWKVNGLSVARVLYEKQYVELSEEYVPGWVFAEDFNDTTHDPRWITDLFGLIGVKYVIFHKDAKLDSMRKMEDARKYLESAGLLELVTENDSFRLYTIKKECVFPYVYVNAGRISFTEKSSGLAEKIAEFRGTMKRLAYERTGVQSITVDAEGFEENQSVFLNEKYDPLWKAVYIGPSGDRRDLMRDDRVRYANAWKIDEGVGSGKIEIYYMPIRLFFIGMWISGVALVVTVGGLLYFSRRRM